MSALNALPDAELVSPPSDTVSQLSFSPVADLLALSAWNGEVRIYQVGQNGMTEGKAGYVHECAAALCVGWSSDGTKVFSGSSDHTAKIFDATTGQSAQFGMHDAPISRIEWINAGSGLVLTGSWDKSLRYWDLRARAPALQVNLPERCYALSCVFPLLVVGTADRHIQVFDINQPTQPYKSLSSPLKMQTRSISCFPDAQGFSIGSVEGRVGVQYVDDAKATANFTFKCHRKDRQGSGVNSRQQQDVFAVNSIAYNNLGTFVTAGSDGELTIWDHYLRARLKTLTAPGPITSTAFSYTSRYLAYSVSYDWSKGYAFNSPSVPNKVMVHVCQEHEVERKLVVPKK
ncbi:hypothetical protein JCM11491_003073 [Sporobolomyces phaffii]